ncbi:response regulator [Oscillatoria sp. CS-180]|uniref:response regulator n=1 Tax=Oscillatoria sp. CS-180 TaxID=3021720 RepID=UPI00232AE7D1|nr:response regulator [Oscillatoria sp. CS-180]MDB9528765.1 response regulator [Oscillatoria sp. CS-180]
MTDQSYPALLVVEDSDEDFEALGRIMRKNCSIQVPLTRCIDGDDALDFLYRKGAYVDYATTDLPGLILLDLNLPGTDGREVLTEIKRDKRLRDIPVVVLTTSSNPKDVQACYQSGVNSYLIKPTNIQDFKASVSLFVDYWFRVAMLPNA